MKKIIGTILLIAMLLGLMSACGATEPETPETTTEVTTAVPSMDETKESTSATETTTAETTRQTTRQTVKVYGSSEVESIVEEEIELAIMENRVLPPEGYPEGYPMPHAVEIYAKKYNVTANAYCIFGENDSEIFVIYRYAGYGPYFPTEICYHGSVGGVEPWDRIGYTGGEVAEGCSTRV